MILGICINKRILLSSRITGANGHVGCSTSIHSAGIFFSYTNPCGAMARVSSENILLKAFATFQKLMGPHNGK